jgi:outer membrane protein
MKRILKVISFLFACFISIYSYGQTELNSVEEAVRFGMRNNVLIQNYQLQEMIARDQAKLTTSVLLPQLRAFSSFDDYLSLPVQLIPAEFLGGREGEFREVQFGTKYNLSMGLEASVPIINTTAWENKRQANFNAEIVKADKEVQETNIKTEIAKAYHRSILTRSLVEQTSKLHRSNDSLYRITKNKLSNGLVEQAEVNRLHTMALESKNQHLAASSLYQRNMLVLKFLLGLDQAAELLLPEEIALEEDPIIITFEAKEIIVFPEYTYYQVKALLAKSEVQKQKLKRLPELNAYARYTHQAQRNEFNFLQGDLPWFQIGVVGVRLDLPLFTGFSRHNSIKVANGQLKIAENNLNYYKMRLENERADVLVNYNHLKMTVSNSRESFLLAKENYEIALIKYNNEVIGTDILLQEYQNYIRYQNDYINKLMDYYGVAAELKKREENW